MTTSAGAWTKRGALPRHRPAQAQGIPVPLHEAQLAAAGRWANSTTTTKPRATPAVATPPPACAASKKAVITHDKPLLETSVDRDLMMHHAAGFLRKTFPMLNCGDEIAQLNGWDYKERPGSRGRQPQSARAVRTFDWTTTLCAEGQCVGLTLEGMEGGARCF